MAISKIIGSAHAQQGKGKHTVMGKLINYVLNPKKTDEGRLTGAHNCLKATALKEMITTKQLYGKDIGNDTDRQMYHYTISWHPDENITPEIALNVIREFVERYLKDEYEAVYSVHNDHDHIHGHIAFNSVNLQTGYKFRYEDGDWARYIQPLVDEICASRGLHTLYDDTGMTLEEYEEDRKQNKSRSTQRKRRENTEHKKRHYNMYHKDSEESYSRSDHIREDIDYAIFHSSNFEEFEAMLYEMGYQIKYGNSEIYGETMKLKAPGMEIYRRTHTLGSEYTVQHIKERILIKDKPLPVIILPVRVRMIIPAHFFTRYRRLTLNPALRRYYRRLYRLGIKPNYPKRNYIVSKEAVERAERIEQHLLLRLNNNINNYDDAIALAEQKKREYEQLELEKKALYEKHKPYRKMLAAYKKAIKLKSEYEDYQAGDVTKEEAALEYEKQVKIYQKYGFSEEEIKNYQKSMAAEFREMKERMSKKQIAIETVMELAGEYEEEPDDNFTPEEEQFYNNIQLPAVQEATKGVQI